MSFNVIIVNDFAHVDGGSSKVAIKTAIILAKNGYKVTFFTAVPPIEEEIIKYGIQVIITEQIDIQRNPSKLKAGLQGLWNRKAEKKLIEILRTYNPSKTIIHIHSWTKALSPSIFHAAVKEDFKFVITLHDYFLLCPNGGLFNYKANKACSFKPMSIECFKNNCDSRAFYFKIWRFIRHFLFSIYLHGKYDKLNIIAPSKFSYSVIERYLPIHKNIYLINNPIDIERDKPVNVHKNKQFVYVGRLSIEKGVLIFAEAASRLNLDAMFIGDGYLRDKILQTYPKAIITGWVSEDKLKKLLRKTRVLVYPSLSYETQGMAVLEAKAMGIPSIVSNNCAAKDHINPMKDGLLFKSCDVNNLIEMIKICHNDEFICNMGAKSYESYWKNPLTNNKYFEELVKCYQSIFDR